jgi:GT2 family glycosyltransferase
MVNQGGIIIHPAEYPVSVIMDVDVIGACYLIPRKAFEDGVRYDQHAQGEDVAFCEQAKNKGYRLIVNMDCQPQHRMVATC